MFAATGQARHGRAGGRRCLTRRPSSRHPPAGAVAPGPRGRPAARAEPRCWCCSAWARSWHPGAAVPVDLQPDRRHRPGLDHRRSRRSARRWSSSPATSTCRSRRSSASSPSWSPTSWPTSSCRRPRRWRSASASGSCSAWSTASSWRSSGCPSIVATLGTLSIYRGIDFLLAGGKQVTLTELPPGYTDAARGDVVGHPALRPHRRGHRRRCAASSCARRGSGGQVYAVGSNPEAAAILGIRTRPRDVRGVLGVRAAGRRRRASCGGSSSGRSTRRPRRA